MKLLPYKELLALSKEKLDEKLAPVRARAQKKRAELEAVKLEEAITNIEQKVSELCSAKELDFNAILDKLDELALAERRQTQVKDLAEQLFPAEK